MFLVGEITLYWKEGFRLSASHTGFQLSAVGVRH
jgi:hypothetical protein